MKTNLTSSLFSFGIVSTITLSLISLRSSAESTFKGSATGAGFENATALFDTSTVSYYSFQNKTSVDYAAYTQAAAVPQLVACMGGELMLSAPQGGQEATYAWTGPNGFKSTEKVVKFYSALPRHAGTYTVEIQENGGITRSVIRVNVNEAPAADIIMADSGQDHVMLLQAAPNDPQAEYIWSNQNGDVMSRSGNFYVSKDETRKSEFRLVVKKNGCSLRVPVQTNIERNTLVSAKSENQTSEESIR